MQGFVNTQKNPIMQEYRCEKCRNYASLMRFEKLKDTMFSWLPFDFNDFFDQNA